MHSSNYVIAMKRIQTCPHFTLFGIKVFVCITVESFICYEHENKKKLANNMNNQTFHKNFKLLILILTYIIDLSPVAASFLDGL